MKCAVILDTRYKLSGEKTGKYPVKLRLTYRAIRNGKTAWPQKYITTGMALSEGEFKSVMTSPRTAELVAIKREIVKLENKALAILENNAHITPELFERELTGKGGYDNVVDLFDNIISRKKADGDVGTASSYEQAKSSFVKFGGEQIGFGEVDEYWLKRYEKDMLKKDRSYSTIGIYLRCLRAAFNMAIKIRKIPADMYPFKHYKIPTSAGQPRPLDEKQKELVLNYKTKDAELRQAADMWKLSYLCYGLSFTDILRLKRKNVRDGMFVIIRHKTRNTNRVRKSLVIPVHKDAQVIIDRWGSKSLAPDSYIFPVLTADLSPAQERDRIKDFIKFINAGLKVIGKELEISKLTTYTARHTFATTIRDKGIGKEYIQEALGHGAMQTTENYLGALDTETRKKISGLL